MYQRNQRRVCCCLEIQTYVDLVNYEERSYGLMCTPSYRCICLRVWSPGGGAPCGSSRNLSSWCLAGGSVSLGFCPWWFYLAPTSWFLVLIPVHLLWIALLLQPLLWEPQGSCHIRRSDSISWFLVHAGGLACLYQGNMDWVQVRYVEESWSRGKEL